MRNAAYTLTNIFSFIFFILGRERLIISKNFIPVFTKLSIYLYIYTALKKAHHDPAS